MPTITAQLDTVKRTPWLPDAQDGDGAVTDSKFSGIPWLAPGESWPVCKNCEAPMQLFVQINLDTIPAPYKGKFGDGLVQLFYCTSGDPHCESECENWFYNETAMLVRLVKPAGAAGSPATSPVAEAFPPKVITGWVAGDPELPEQTEIWDVLGLDIMDPKNEPWEDYIEENENDFLAESGEKLGGWPAWVQGMEYPACRRCGKAMELVFQLGCGEENIPYSFGDAGIGHITQCPDHKDILAFGWACG